MPKLSAKVVKGVPKCPNCGYTHRGAPDDYGIDVDGGGYWFGFICPVCSAKKEKGKPKQKFMVIYTTDTDLKAKKGS